MNKHHEWDIGWALRAIDTLVLKPNNIALPETLETTYCDVYIPHMGNHIIGDFLERSVPPLLRMIYVIMSNLQREAGFAHNRPVLPIPQTRMVNQEDKFVCLEEGNFSFPMNTPRNHQDPKPIIMSYWLRAR